MHLLRFVVSLLSLLCLNVMAATDPICRVWLTQAGEAKLQVYQDNATFEAKIIWLREPNENGRPKVDWHNPDPALRGRPRLGLVILRDLRKSGTPSLYTGGRIYDPLSGKTYDCRITFENDTLALRGYVLGLPFLGRTTVWTKAD